MSKELDVLFVVSFAFFCAALTVAAFAGIGY